MSSRWAAQLKELVFDYSPIYSRLEEIAEREGQVLNIGDLEAVEGNYQNSTFKAQIDHFRKSYKVIAMDGRDQGKSGDSPDKITYEKMTDDLAALLDHLTTGPVYVLGWSDGGVEALLLGIRRK
jgi:pimeloyl-ACP methyl ester carboxylesterase